MDSGVDFTSVSVLSRRLGVGMLCALPAYRLLDNRSGSETTLRLSRAGTCDCGKGGRAVSGGAEGFGISCRSRASVLATPPHERYLKDLLGREGLGNGGLLSPIDEFDSRSGRESSCTLTCFEVWPCVCRLELLGAEGEERCCERVTPRSRGKSFTKQLLSVGMHAQMMPTLSSTLLQSAESGLSYVTSFAIEIGYSQTSRRAEITQMLPLLVTFD